MLEKNLFFESRRNKKEEVLKAEDYLCIGFICHRPYFQLTDYID